MSPRALFLCTLVCALLFASVHSIDLESEDSQGLGCSGVAPGGVTQCVDGYWFVNSSLSLNVPGFDIEGRILINGDFNLTAEALLNWKGFAKTNDSYPELVPTISSFVLAFVNVTGDAILDGGILVDITPDNVDAIIGAVDTNNPKRELKQDIFEASTTTAPGSLNVTLVRATQACRKVTMGAGARSGSGRTTLSALFAIDDSECVDGKKTNKNLVVKIVVPIVCFLVIVAVIVTIMVIYKNERLQRRFMPFASRKRGQRTSITRYSSEPSVEAP